jgi:hypothetical protein
MAKHISELLDEILINLPKPTEEKNFLLIM